jgi:hypothetical protein
VAALPIKLSQISIADSFWRSDPIYSLNSKNVEFFQFELSRIEQQTSSSTNFSQMFLHSRENMFLCEILLQTVDFRFLKRRHPQLLSEALEHSPENIATAASLWTEFAEFYSSLDESVPDLPLYVEIQESLGIYGRGPIERAVRKLVRRVRKRLMVLIERFFGTSEATKE